MARSTDTKTPEAIAAFTSDLFTPRKNDEGKEKYGCTLLFPKAADLSGLEKLALDVAVEEWGEKARQMIVDGVIKSPFLNGDGPQGVSKKTGERHKGFAGHTFIRVTSGADYRPKVFDRKLIPITSVDGCPSGSRVQAVVNAYTWDNPKNGKGITFGVSLVQVVKQAAGDEILGGEGGPAPDKFFEAMPDVDAPAAAQGGKGAGGLFGAR